MEISISNFKTEFNDISLVRNKIIGIFETLKSKMDRLKNLYSDYIKQSNTPLFVFGLDSFHFQNKLIDLEYDDMKRIFLFISNRMYCEYFKLYKLICSYIFENITDKKVLEIIKGNNFVVYKDLEPFKDYKFETTMEIHENILILLNSIIGIINNKENELSLHKNKQLIGLNINNFVSSFNYEITLMKEKINLFLSYIDFFHKLHSKYLKRFNNKIQLILNHINTDIQFDENNENSNDNKISNENNITNYDIPVVNKKLNSLSIDIKNTTNNQIFDDYESLNSSSNSSFKSIELTKNNNDKFRMTKMIRKGFKKVNDIFNGCNNVNYIDDKVSSPLNNKEFVLERLSFDNNINNNANENFLISLNDFNNFSDIETNEDTDIVNDNYDMLPEDNKSIGTDIDIDNDNLFNHCNDVFVNDADIKLVEELIEPVVETVEEVIVPVVEEVIEPVIETVEEPVVEEVIEPVIETVEEPVVEEVIEPLVEELAIETVEEVIEPLVEELAIETVEEVIEPVVETVEEVIEPLVETVEEVIVPLVEEPIVETVEEVIEPLVETVEEVIVPLVETVEEVIEPLVEEVIEPVVEPVVEYEI